MNRQPVYYAAFFTTTFTSLEEVRTKAPEALAEHLAKPRQLAADGVLLMAGAIILAGQLLEAIGAFGWAEFDAYLVLNPELALLHNMGVVLFVPGFLVTLVGAVVTLVRFLRR